MREKKHMLAWFLPYEMAAVRKYLEEMASNGWMLEKAGNFFWKFRKMPPRRLHFDVACFPEASAFDPAVDEKRQALEDLGNTQGWIPVCRWNQLVVFYNESENPIPMDTDPVIQVEAIHRSMKKQDLFSLPVLLGLCLLEMIIIGSRFCSHPLETLASGASLSLLAFWFLLTLTCVSELAEYFHWYKRAKAAAERGIFYEEKPSRATSLILMALAVLVLVLHLASVKPVALIWRTLALIAAFIGVGVLGRTVQNFLYRRNVPRKINQVVSIGLVVALTIFLFTGNLFSVLRTGGSNDDSAVRTYSKFGVSLTVYNDDIPLCVEDLMDVPVLDWSREKREDTSFLLSRTQYRQWPLTEDRSVPDLAYTVTECKLPFLTDFCRNAALWDNQDEKMSGGGLFINHYEPIDASPWCAECAYQLHWSNSVLNRYLLFCGNRIVEIDLPSEPTAEQMQVVAEKLME